MWIYVLSGVFVGVAVVVSKSPHLKRAIREITGRSQADHRQTTLRFCDL